MKMTIDLPDDLFVAVEHRAAEDRTTVRAIVERGLRQQLRTPRRGVRRAGTKIKWVTVDGGLPAGLDVSDRAAMHEWLRLADRRRVVRRRRGRAVDARRRVREGARTAASRPAGMNAD
jgi:hypothetical protein